MKISVFICLAIIFSFIMTSNLTHPEFQAKDDKKQALRAGVLIENVLCFDEQLQPILKNSDPIESLKCMFNPAPVKSNHKITVVKLNQTYTKANKDCLISNLCYAGCFDSNCIINNTVHDLIQTKLNIVNELGMFISVFVFLFICFSWLYFHTKNSHIQKFYQTIPTPRTSVKEKEEDLIL